MHTFKWLWGYMKKYRLKMFTALICGALFLVGTFTIPVVLGKIVDDVIIGGETSKLLLYCSLALLGVVLRDVVRYIRSIVLESLGQSVVKNIRDKLFSKLQRLDASYFDKTKKGDIMSRLTMDTDSIQLVARHTIWIFLDQIALVIIGLFVLLSNSWQLTLLIFASSPFIFYFAFKFSKNVKKDFLDLRESNSHLTTVVTENIEGNRVVKAYANEEFEIEKFEQKNKGYMDAFMRHVYTWSRYIPKMSFFIYFGVNAVFLIMGAFLIMKDVITIGQFTLFNACIYTIVDPLATLAPLINQIQQFNASSKKLITLENEEPKIVNRNVKKRDTGIEGKIEFRNVSFSYGAQRVLKDINFSCEPGQTIGIIGPTGSGKSSLINLISRFYDVSAGAIYIDDINIKNIDIKTIHQNVASALQDVFLFSDTIKNNISYASPNATIDDVIRVSKLANAHSFIKSLPDGYDTMVGERGAGLSGGQKQRISLARALLKNPSILILDDTTSALDMETEYEIQKSLRQTKQTKIIIAHRISSVKNADLILVLNQGHLVEWGTHNELMEQNGYYKGVYEHQFGDFENAPKYHIKHPALESMGGDK